jgi:VWFA-related protein
MPSFVLKTRRAPFHLAKVFAFTLFVCVFADGLIGARAQASGEAPPQTFTRELAIGEGGEIYIKNFRGRVSVTAAADARGKISLRAESPRAISASDVRVESGTAIDINVPMRAGASSGRIANSNRIDLILRVPPKMRVRVETDEGAVDLTGEFAFASVVTKTGTLRADMPVDSLRYDFHWTASRPRVFSEIKLADVQERRGGRYEIVGALHKKDDAGGAPPSENLSHDESETTKETAKTVDKNSSRKNESSGKGHFGLKFPKLSKHSNDAPTDSTLEFTTERGLLLFGVSDPAMVPSDLRERPLTEAARAIIRSGNEDLIEAIARVSPKYVKEYAERLPDARETAPTLRDAKRGQRVDVSESIVNASDVTNANVKYLIRLNASVTDPQGRAISGLTAKDFKLFENGEPRKIEKLEPTNAPFNLVLLLDVSGSVEERLDFIRKAANSFVSAIGAQDRVAIITFNDDVKVISGFTSDRALLTARINDIEAGGATALYDALAYALVDTLRPVRNQRTGIVILSDGDDNKSFIPFRSILEATIESGALIYPLYVPSGLIPEKHAPAPVRTLDPTRARYLTLTSRAEEEGRKLAESSGGVYFPVTRFDDLPKAFADIIAHLRTAYSLIYASPLNTANINNRRILVKVERPNAQVTLSPAISVK